MIDQQLAELSNLAIVISIVLYVLALLGFSADLASRSQRRSDARLASSEPANSSVRTVAVGAPSANTAYPAAGGGATAVPEEPGHTPTPPSTMTPQNFAFLFGSAAAVLHTIGVILRAVATQRVPWANMYEFSTTSTVVVMVLFLSFSVTRRELRTLGTFVVGAALLVLLLAQTIWIVPAASLTPSLQNSHWLIIHIGVAILSTALSILGALVASFQLLQARHEKAVAERVTAEDEHPEHWGRAGRVLDNLPTSKVLEALSFRVHSIAFVSWTFTLIFGAIWGSDAWGRYWGWDPKEVWTFIIWVIYAAYLHARATGGFRRSRAAWLALIGFVAVVFNYTIVNTVINGLHSYSGL